MNEEDIVEALADLEHERWSSWMEYLFEVSTENEDGSVTIPSDKVERWQRQIDTPYDDLSDKEQESDRKEARKTIALLKSVLKGD